MSIIVRPMRADEGHTFLDIHTRSIRGLASSHYTADVIDAWVVPATEENVLNLLKNPDDEVRLIAELDGEPVGLGVLVVRTSELRGCYVVPEAAREGAGSALVKEIERIARANGLTELDLHASINAELFYQRLGYSVVERGEHVLRSGQRMAAVTMQKKLGLSGGAVHKAVPAESEPQN